MSVQISKLSNAAFYDGAGVFLQEKAKEAYFSMMDAYGYPISEQLRKEMWVTDFGQGDFVNVGMAGVIWVNEISDGYFAHEIYLLPGQMIAEHAHLVTGLVKPKMESWHVRYGEVFTFGEEGLPPPSAYQIPASQQAVTSVHAGRILKTGEIGKLNRITAFHFMMGGPQGAIVSEYGMPHDGDALLFKNPSAVF